MAPPTGAVEAGVGFCFACGVHESGCRRMTRARFVFLVLGLVAIVVSSGCTAGESKKPESGGGATSVSAPFAVTIEDGQATIWPGGSPIKTNISAPRGGWGGTAVSLRGGRVALLNSVETKKITVVDESGSGPSADVGSGCDSIAAREDGVALLCSEEIPGGYEVRVKIFNRDLELESDVKLPELATRTSPIAQYAGPPILIAAGLNYVWVSYPSERAFSRGGNRILVKFSAEGRFSTFTPIEGGIAQPAISPNGRMISIDGNGSCGASCATSSLHVINLETMRQLWSSTYVPPTARHNELGSVDFEITKIKWIDDDNLVVLGSSYIRCTGSNECKETKPQYWRRRIEIRVQRANDELLESPEYEEVSWLGPGCDDVIRTSNSDILLISKNGMETKTPGVLAIAVERPAECQ